MIPLPPLDRGISPHTGLTRAHWESVADHLLLALRPHASSGHALVSPPGRPSRSGPLSDGLEGFARSFLLVAGLIRARGDGDPHGHADWYAAGLAAGVDPGAEDAWPRPADRGQAKVEACALALALDATRAQIWDHLDAQVRERLIDWFAEVIGTPFPDNNWVWFRIIVLTFLRSVDDRFVSGDRADAILADLAHDLALHETFVREGGWFADGPERSYDHYADWVFALLPALWQRMEGARPGGTLDRPGLLGADERARHRGRLEQYLPDALGLLGADGSPLIQGRSLVYRMASAGAFWAGAFADSDAVPPGLLRRAASGTLAHFFGHGVPDRDGLLGLGWFHAFEQMAQPYSGPGSPYWASMGFAGLLLPADHPVWTAPEEPLPVEREDGVSVLAAPGWIVSRTRSDGIVRVMNHGTDHAAPGSDAADDPLYARLGYSTATSPQMVPDPVEPRDATVGLVDPVRGWSHRTGFETLSLRSEGTGQGAIGIGISRQRCHWPQGDADSRELIVATVSHGADAVVLVRSGEAGTGGLPIGVAGWPLSAARAPMEEPEGKPVEERTHAGEPVRSVADGMGASGAERTTREAALSIERADGTRLRSALRILQGDGRARVRLEVDVSPLGSGFAVPEALVEAGAPGDVVAILLRLEGGPTTHGHADAGEPSSAEEGTDAGEETDAGGRAEPSVRRTGSGELLICWGEGVQAIVDLGDPRATAPTAPR
jgi:hypothetical protein